MYRELKPSTLLSPVPVVMVSCAGTREGEKVNNIVTVAWAGTINSEPPMVSISLRKSRFSHELVSETGEFVINLVGENNLKATDWCGVKSGRDTDKFADMSLESFDIPGLEFAKGVKGCPVYLGCKVRQTIELGSHDIFIAEVVAAGADEQLFDGEGKMCLDRAKLVAYCHGEYVGLGRLLGFFGYSVASPEVLKRRMPKDAK